MKHFHRRTQSCGSPCNGTKTILDGKNTHHKIFKILVGSFIVIVSVVVIIVLLV